MLHGLGLTAPVSETVHRLLQLTVLRLYYFVFCETDGKLWFVLSCVDTVVWLFIALTDVSMYLRIWFIFSSSSQFSSSASNISASKSFVSVIFASIFWSISRIKFLFLASCSRDVFRLINTISSGFSFAKILLVLFKNLVTCALWARLDACYLGSSSILVTAPMSWNSVFELYRRNSLNSLCFS